MMRVAAVLAAAAASWLGTISYASAEVIWSSIATACMPDSGAIQGDYYSSSPDSGVKPNSGVFDPIVLICPMTVRPAVPPDVLSMTYRDSTGDTNSARVQAQFIRVNRNNANRAVIATLSSDSFAQTTVVKRLSARFNHTLSGNFYYYIRIELDRTTNSEVVRSVGVALEKSEVVSIEVSSAETIFVGEVWDFTATGTYSDDSTGDVTDDATWSSSSEDVATIDQNGRATGVGEGSTTIRAEIGETFGTSQLQVESPPQVCGDGSIHALEQCDDGNLANGDGCSSMCEVEPGYLCTGQPSMCTPI